MKAWQWGKVRWALTVWSGLVLVWIVYDVGTVLSKNCSEDSLIDDAFEGTFKGIADCASIYVKGKSSVATEHAIERLGVGLVGAAVIGLVWLLTRERARVCPQCGENVAKGLTACPSCGYDFGQAVATPQASTPTPVAAAASAGWYDDSARAGHKRWWDGAAWGISDDEHPSVVSGTQPADPVVVGASESSPVEAAEPVVVAAAAEPITPATSAADPLAAPEPEAADPPARFCENCGAPRRPGGKFCTSCGHA